MNDENKLSHPMSDFGAPPPQAKETERAPAETHASEKTAAPQPKAEQPKPAQAEPTAKESAAKKSTAPTKPKTASKSGKGFGDVAMTAMFIGLVAAYVGSYVGTFTSTGNFMPLVVLAVSAVAMAVFTFFSEKKQQTWLDNFSVAGSMLFGMAAAVLVGSAL